MVVTKRLRVETRGNNDLIDITPQVRQAVAQSGLRSGVAVVFVVGSTAGVTTIENESGLLSDLKATLERVVPQNPGYRHHQRWGEDNAHAHLRASLWGASLTVPFENGSLLLGTWQQIIFMDFDTRPRSREVVLQLIGE